MKSHPQRILDYADDRADDAAIEWRHDADSVANSDLKLATLCRDLQHAFEALAFYAHEKKRGAA